MKKYTEYFTALHCFNYERALIVLLFKKEHGYCPDRKTKARGPDFKGCDNFVFYVIWFEFVRFLMLIWFNCILIFLKKEHGCCPDGKTKARGPDFRGCDNATPCKGGVISECIFKNFLHPERNPESNHCRSAF